MTSIVWFKSRVNILQSKGFTVYLQYSEGCNQTTTIVDSLKWLEKL